MRFGFNVITNFLWETYDIDSGTYLRKKILKASAEEKDLLNKHHVLDNLFLIRRVEDPGFYLHVTKEVKNDADTLEKVEHYVKKLVLNHCYDVDFDIMEIFPNTRQNVFDIDEGLTHSFDVTFDVTNFPYEKENEITLKYLKARNEIASEKGDEDEMLSIAHKISDYTTGKYHIHYLFNKQDLYKNLDSTRDVIAQNKKYAVENIRNEYLYDDHREFAEKMKESFLLDTFNAAILLTPEFIVRILKTINDKFGSDRMPSMDEILKHSKFISDFISIASLVWFDKHKESEKISILNGNYKFSISEEILLEHMNNEVNRIDSEKTIFGLSSKALSFYEENYLEEAEIIWSFVESKTKNIWLQYSCLSNIATAAREKMNYEKALETYKRAFELLSHLNEKAANKALKEFKKHVSMNSIRYPAYHQAVDLKNIGEMYYQLGDIENGDKHLLQAEQFKGIHAEDKIIIYWNLACAYRRVSNFKKECYYLNKVLDIRSNKYSKLKDEANLRLNILNSPEFILYDGSFDSKKLSIIDKKEKQTTYYEKAISLLREFQVEKSIEYLDYAISITDDKKLYLPKALAYFSIGNLDAAKKTIQPLKEEEHSIPKILYYSLMGTIQIHEGKIEEGIEKMEKAIRFGFTPTALDTAYRTHGNLNNWAAGYLLSPYAKYILPLKDQELTYRVFDRLESTLNEFEIGASSSELIGTLLMNYGFTDEANRYFERGINRSDIPEKYKADLYLKKGILLSIENKSKEALVNLDKSLEISKRPLTLEKKGEVYRNLFDFKNAIHCINEAQKLDPENPKYLELMEEYSYLEKSVINIQKIRDDNVLSMIHTAENLMLKFYKNIDAKTASFDYSIASVEYGKALEQILHNNISRKIREEIITGDRPIIEDKYWKGRYGIKSKITLRNILGIEEKSIALGQWRYFLEDVNYLKNKNPIALRVNNYIVSNTGKEKIESFTEACNLISELRNGSAHIDVKNRDDVMEVRKEIVDSLNTVISEIY